MIKFFIFNIKRLAFGATKRFLPFGKIETYKLIIPK